MRIELTELQWLDAGQALSLSAFMQISGLQETEIRELVDYGVLTPLNSGALPWNFSAGQVAAARSACRLRDGFGLDSPGLAVALTLLERVRELQQQLQELDAVRPRSPL